MEQDIFNIEAENKKINAEQRRERVRELSDLKRILKLPEGRRFFWKLLGECGIFRNSFSANSNQTAFAEGIRNVGLRILKDINEADVTAFSKMQNEYLSALHSRKEANDNK